MWTDEQINDNVAAVVREVMHALSMSPSALARDIGMKRSTLYTRLDGETRFTAPEMYRLTQVLGISLEALYRPVDLLRAEIEEAQAELAQRVQNWKFRGRVSTGLATLPSNTSLARVS